MRKLRPGGKASCRDSRQAETELGPESCPPLPGPGQGWPACLPAGSWWCPPLVPRLDPQAGLGAGLAALVSGFSGPGGPGSQPGAAQETPGTPLCVVVMSLLWAIPEDCKGQDPESPRPRSSGPCEAQPRAESIVVAVVSVGAGGREGPLQVQPQR